MSPTQSIVDSQVVFGLHEIGRSQCGHLIRPCLAYARALGHSPPNDEIAWRFRSEELSEAAAGVFPESCATRFSHQIVKAFAAFLAERAALIETDGLQVDSSLLDSELNRPQSLLITDWANSLFDGALTPETAGFLNDDAMPPWDTWLALLSGVGSDSRELTCLLSWVPAWMAGDVDRSIFIDAADCLSWGRFDSRGRLAVHGWGRRWEADND